MVCSDPLLDVRKTASVPVPEIIVWEGEVFAKELTNVLKKAKCRVAV